MAIVYRTSGPWGTGKGSDLTPVEVDGNFWQLLQDVLAKAVQGVGISNFVVSGNQFTVVLTDHTLLGPYTLPVAALVFKGEWLPGHTYLANDIITHAGSTYMVLFNHTSAATFDPGANDGSGHNFYGLLLQNPAVTIPAGGVAGTFLRKLTSVDYAAAWETAALTDLSDVTIASPLEGEFLSLLHGVWTNVPAPVPVVPPGSLATLSDVSLSTLNINEVLTWNGTNWANAPPHLSAISGVLITSPARGQPLVYDGTNWVNASAVDPPVNNIGSVSGSYSLSLQANAATRLTMTGNLSIGSFTWPSTSSGQFIHRVVEIKNNGSFTLTWPSLIKWSGGIIPAQTPGGLDVYVIHTFDGGATVYGSIIGQGYN